METWLIESNEPALAFLASPGVPCQPWRSLPALAFLASPGVPCQPYPTNAALTGRSPTGINVNIGAGAGLNGR
jgi:hypothetical protein